MSIQAENAAQQEFKGRSETTGSITMVFSPEMMQSIRESLVIYLRSNPEFVRDILNDLFKANPEEIHLKSVPKDVAKKMIGEFIQKNPGVKTSDIIMKLELEPALVVEILKELESEDSVLSKSIE
jgi:hypothetical protein